MFNPGNFALYNKKRVIILSKENDNAIILDGSIKATVPLSELEPYIKSPQGMTPISMSAPQEHTVNAICATLGYQTVELLDETGKTINPEHYVALDLIKVCTGDLLFD